MRHLPLPARPISRWYSFALLLAGLTALSACAGEAALPGPTNAPTDTTGNSPTSAPESTPARPPASERWQPAPPLQHARSAHSVVSTEDAIYVLAGTGEGRAPVSEVERLDGEEWLVETTLPGEGLNAPAAVVLEGRIYLIGGFKTVSNIPSAEGLVYNLEARSWSEAAPLPAPRGGHAAVVLEGRIHVLGGGNSLSTIADHSMYDPATDSWTELAPLPRAKGSPAAVVFDGKIYAIGGRSGSSDFGEVDIYDAATDRWTEGPAIEPRGTAGAAVYRDAIYLFGGESQARRETLSSVLRLDPSNGDWQEVSPMPVARNYARAVLFDDAVYIVGGGPEPGSSHSSAGSTIVERYDVPTP